jgi:hypothetical protein
MAHADALTKAERKAADVAEDAESRKTWSKPCPKCKRQVPARRYTCDCGYQFTASPQGGKPRTAVAQATPSRARPR